MSSTTASDKEGVTQVGELVLGNLLHGMWKGFKRLWLWLLLLICAAMLLAYGDSASRYRASASFSISANVASGATTYYNRTAAKQLATTFPYILTSSPLSNVVAADLGLESIPGSISASAVEDTSLFTIEVTADDPEMAYNILNSVIYNYPKIAKYVIGDTQLELLNEPSVPTAPYNAVSLKRAAYLGILVGAVLDLALLAIYGMMNDTVRTTADVEMLLRCKVVGAIAEQKTKKRRSGKSAPLLITSPRVDRSFSDSIQALRSTVLRSLQQDNIKVMMVTSALPGEGKSTIAVNLALALAKRGKKVLLIDADMRRSSLQRMLPPQRADVSTLADVLQGKAAVESALQILPKLPMWVVYGGNAGKASAELAGSEKMRQLIEELSGYVDYVIVDTPPVGIMSESLAMAEMADGLLMVVRQDYARRRDVLAAMESFGDTGVQLMGCVLNCVTEGYSRYGYGYAYGRYGRGYYGHYGHYSRYGSYGYGHRYGGYGYGSAADDDDADLVEDDLPELQKPQDK
mgnify:CR=1 FL=1